MNVLTWNVNSIRKRTSAAQNTLERLLRSERPDVVCLQELQCKPQQVPHESFALSGYRALVSAEKGKNGVAILTSLAMPAPTPVHHHPWPPPGAAAGVGQDARFCAAEIGGVIVASVYAPYGRSPSDPQWQAKIDFFAALSTWSRQVIETGQCLLLSGDFNVAPKDTDWTLADKAPELKTSREHPYPQCWQAWCHPTMREAFKSLLRQGLVDLGSGVDVPARPTLFDERNFGRHTSAGVRVDLFLASLPMAARLLKVATLTDTRTWNNPSDHVPVAASFRQLQRIYSSFGGSRLHGTSTQHSDVDIQGIVLASAKDVILGRVCSKEAVYRQKAHGEKNHELDIDIHFDSPLDFVHSLAQGQPISWELLFAPPGSLLPDTTPLGLRFVSTLRSHVDSLLTADPTAVLGKTKQFTKRIVRELNLRGLDSASEAALIDAVAVADDGKKLAHALRLLEQTTELYEHHRITLPRPNAEELLAIKRNELPLSRVLPRIEAARRHMLAAVEHSGLPAVADTTAALCAVEDLMREHIGLLARPGAWRVANKSLLPRLPLPTLSRNTDALDLSWPANKIDKRPRLTADARE